LIQFLISISLFLGLFIHPDEVMAKKSNIDLTSAQISVGHRFAKVFCEAIEGGVNSEIASEYALNNTYLKFVAFPDDDKYLDDLWAFTSRDISNNCGKYVDLDEINELENFFREEGIIASNREYYLPTFENN